MQYVVNGRVFDAIEEAEKYESELKEKEIEKQKKEAIKETKFKELKALETQYINKVNEFCNDYGYYEANLKGLFGVKKIHFNDFFEDFNF